MILLPPWAAPLLSFLVLQFDGSLRPPRDTGFPTAKLGRLASCSAAVLSSEQKVMAIGGKTLPLVPGMTSADVEFEGLLMGLHFLCQQQETFKNSDGDDKLTVIVQGDCKAIIDLMNGDARPRKLESMYIDAKILLDQLNLDDEICFEHILRDSNTLSDSICAQVMDLAIQQECMRMRSDMMQSQYLTDSLSKYFGVGNSIIPFTQRLGVYNEILERARDTGDGLGLQQLGFQLADDAKLWPANDVPPCRQSLSTLAIRIQLEGYELLLNDKEASKLSRKHRFILDKYAEQSEVHLLALAEDTVEASIMQPPVTESIDNAEAVMVWQKEAREQFLRGESMRKVTRQVWVMTS